jgi:RNA-directed DNA polymerase
LKAWKKFDLERRLGARIINYADDLVIVTRGRAEEALEWLRWITERLGLRLNEEKTCVRDARREHFDFLGYTFGPQVSWKGKRYVGFAPSKKRVKRLKVMIRAALRPGNQAPIDVVVQELNRTLRGWKAYFRLGTRLKAHQAIDHYTRQSLRQFLVRRHKAPGRGVRRFSYAYIHDRLGLVRLVER